jgi:nitronate monooxygenase
MNALSRLVGTRLPIVQAPMAGAQAGAMAVAACEAGALGSLPCAMLTVEGMRAELELIRSRTKQPYNVNFFCHVAPEIDAAREAGWRERLAPYYSQFGIDAAKIPAGPGRSPFTAAAADVLEDYRPPVVSFHFGLPEAALLARVKSWGAKVMASATTVEEARWLEARGVDVVIAQGVEAGGHRGMFLATDPQAQLGTFALVPQVVAAVKVPVIAAGGIADAAGVRAAISLGAAGVQAGTAFLLCPEATTSAIHRAALRARPHETMLTNLFTGRPARGVVNRVMRELGAINGAVPAFPLATAAIAPLRARAEAGGSGDFSPLWSGQNATGCREVPAGEIVAALAAGLEAR